MKTGFLTFEQYHGKKDIGSSRIRCDWLIKHWKAASGIGDAERFTFGQKYDIVVFQKAYWIEYAQAFEGIKILDICDADWLQWSYNIKQMIDLCDAVTCSTMEIAKFLVQLTDKPVVVIPDRVDFSEMPKPKVHEGPLKTAVWYGYAENFEVLEGAIPALKKRGIDLIVVSNKSFSTSIQGIEIKNFPWSPKTWIGDVMRGDVVLNPISKVGRFKYKSDNKTVQAWALGLPVVYTDKELDFFKDAEERNLEAKKRYAEVRTERDVKQSVVELSELIQEIYADKGIQVPN
jgi:hypothetical protein